VLKVVQLRVHSLSVWLCVYGLHVRLWCLWRGCLPAVDNILTHLSRVIASDKGGDFSIARMKADYEAMLSHALAVGSPGAGRKRRTAREMGSVPVHTYVWRTGGGCRDGAEPASNVPPPPTPPKCGGGFWLLLLLLLLLFGEVDCM
jgi:hypothetical protein